MWAFLLLFAPISADIVDEVNRLRSDPGAYSRKLLLRREFYRGNILRLPGRTPLRTVEGVKALDEAVRALRQTRPLPPLAASEALAKAARDHIRDIGPAGKVTHTGSDGSSPASRMRRYDRRVRTTGEVITFGPSDAESVVIDLLVDDGVPERGHRRLLLDAAFAVAGAACGNHSRFRTVCVLDLAR